MKSAKRTVANCMEPAIPSNSNLFDFTGREWRKHKRETQRPRGKGYVAPSLKELRPLKKLREGKPLTTKSS